VCSRRHTHPLEDSVPRDRPAGPRPSGTSVTGCEIYLVPTCGADRTCSFARSLAAGKRPRGLAVVTSDSSITGTGPRRPSTGVSDRTGFWLALGGIFVVLGAAATAIGAAEYHPPWTSAWFIAGMTLGGLGCFSAFWALVLHVAHSVAEEFWCPDRQAHAEKRQNLPSARPTQQSIEVDLVRAEIPGESHWGPYLRCVLLAMSVDLRQAAAAIERAKKDNSYAAIGSEFDLSDHWKNDLPKLANLANREPYEHLRSAYAHIKRIRRIIFGSPSKPMITEPHPGHDLDAALREILKAEEVVNKELTS
jgi:hypothetical protein